MKSRFFTLAIVLFCSSPASAAGLSFSVSFPASMSAAPLDGHVTLLVAKGAPSDEPRKLVSPDELARLVGWRAFRHEQRDVPVKRGRAHRRGEGDGEGEPGGGGGAAAEKHYGERKESRFHIFPPFIESSSFEARCTRTSG